MNHANSRQIGSVSIPMLVLWQFIALSAADVVLVKMFESLHPAE